MVVLITTTRNSIIAVGKAVTYTRAAEEPLLMRSACHDGRALTHEGNLEISSCPERRDQSVSALHS